MDKLKTINIENISKISKKMIEKLNELNIFTIYDLLYYFPNRYENYDIANIHLANHDEKITVVGKIVTEPVFNYFRKNKSRLIFSIVVDDVIIKIIAFNRDFLRGKIVNDMFVTITGKYDKNKAQIIASELKLSKQESNKIIGVYSLKGLHRTYFLNVVKKAINEYSHYFNDDLPLTLIKKYRLISNQELFIFAHFPVNNEQVRQVIRRVKYEELLKFQIKINYLKAKERIDNNKAIKKFNEIEVNNFINNLPFELTSDQTQVVYEILDDMKKPYQMNRLLQGDVGSGKTVVGVIGLFTNYLSSFQGCIMAPTEILAKQHYNYLKSVFSSYNIKIALLTSSTKSKEKSQILSALKENELNIIIGTHALISQGVDFYNLGLIIVDEQHRFGVNQRKLLRDKGMHPDALFLSATPIPRTLALSVFGDMEVSSIKEMPKGRKQIKTYLVRSKLENRLLKFIDEVISLNQQVYVITPLIEESEKIDLENAINVYQKYQSIYKEKYKVGLLHSKLTSDEKESVMNSFKQNDIQILVSTTVVEVGVDVSNATLMVIIDAERFGLAQLHQLRGRVGRGDKQSYCILISDHQNDKTLKRLEILTKTNSGFEIAEADLKLRGPGDFFGNRQSGLPKFRMADIINDYKILEVARNDALMIVASKELFTNGEYFALRQYIENELIKDNEIFD